MGTVPEERAEYLDHLSCPRGWWARRNTSDHNRVEDLFPSFPRSASSTLIQVLNEVSSALLTFLPRARPIRRRDRNAAIQAVIVVTTKKLMRIADGLTRRSGG
jgi:hypothetical protein